MNRAPSLLAAAANDSGPALDQTNPVPWIVLAGLVVSLLTADLWRHRQAHKPSPSEALRESLFWVACGLAFSLYVLATFGEAALGEYLSGYLIEKALSVDNVFVWSVIFTSFAIPEKFQHRVLFLGIFGALVFRAVFIFVGAALIERFEFLLFALGAFLVYTGYRLLRGEDEDGDEPPGRRVTLLVRRIIPLTDEYDGQRFLTRRHGRLVATPLLVALVVVELTDVVFAVDSVPAILAISRNEYIVLASNAFAILGLRAMYFLLANARERFAHLGTGLGVILAFVGLKMMAAHWYHLNVWVSLTVIGGVLAVSIVLSQRRSREEARLACGVDAEAPN